jgi:cytochrome c oxidase subunit 3
LSISAVFIALAAGIVGWLALATRLSARSWEGETAGDVGALGWSPARIGLWAFMAVVTSLFSLFLSAYVMRMHQGLGWCHLTIPNLLWYNTLVLLGASVTMQFASGLAGRGRRDASRTALIAGGVLTIAFLAGQVMAWQAVGPSLYFLQGSPAIAFFYVLTILHGLHLIGGLYVLGRTTMRFGAGAEIIDLRQSLSLCATYWHFLLLVWLAVFGVLLFL